jgi:hypothetical protein
MKFKYILFLPLLVMLAASCSKPKRNIPFPVPSGTFAGEFDRLRLNSSTQKYDTLRANITLVMNLTDGYKIIGDTSVHAGSHGNFIMSAVEIAFEDSTYLGAGLPEKPHLLGTYQYNYNGTTLHMQQTYPNDTLGFFYNLTKQ